MQKPARAKRATRIKSPTMYMIGLFLWAFCSVAFAENTGNLEMISRHPQWLALLHFRSPLLATSSIINRSFFLHPEGRKDAYLELKATIEALNLPANVKPNLHARCLYPGRFLFLQKHLGKHFFTALDVQCPNLKKWTSKIRNPDIRVIFVSGYFGNPASVFGHVLVSLNSTSGLQSKTLLSQALNVGALVPKNENVIRYIGKGIFGGYKTRFSNKLFFYYHHNYVEVESRDMWLYRLKMTDFEKKLLIAHAWELSRAELNYFFIQKNCATEMHYFANVAFLGLPKPFRFWHTPQDFIHAIPENRIDSVELKRGPDTRLHDAHDHLSRQEQKLLKEVLAAPANIAKIFSEANLTDDEKIRILDTAIIYTEQLNNEKNRKQYHRVKQKLFVQRLALTESTPQVPPSIREHPVKRSRVSMLQLGGQYDSRLDSPYAYLRIRPAYQDSLTAGIEPRKRRTLSLFDTMFRLYRNGIKLSDMEYLALESFGLGATRLPLDNPLAWSISAATHAFGESYQRTAFTGGIGYAQDFMSEQAIFLRGHSEILMGRDAGFYGGPEIGLALRATQYLDSITKVHLLLNHQGKVVYNTDVRLRIGGGKNWDLRSSFRRYFGEHAYRAGISRYW